MNSELVNIFGQWNDQNEGVLQEKFPLHKASRDGDVQYLCLLLLRDGEEAVLKEDVFYGWTPAHWACYFGKLECLKRLVHVNHFVNVKTSRFLQTPLHIAAFGGHPDCVQWLLREGADPDQRDYLGETPLHKAARSKSIDCITLLASRGAKLDILSNSGLTAHKLAMSCGYTEVAERLQLFEHQMQNGTNGFTNGISNGHHVNGYAHDEPKVAGKNGFKTLNVSNGYYGYHPITQPQNHDDSEMETNEAAASIPKLQQGGVITNGFHPEKMFSLNGSFNNNNLSSQNGDSFMNPDISVNSVSVVSRKRSRGEISHDGVKRVRQEAPPFKNRKRRCSIPRRLNLTHYQDILQRKEERRQLVEGQKGLSSVLEYLQGDSRSARDELEIIESLLKQTHGCDMYNLLACDI